MKIIVDTNIIFSLLLKENTHFRKLIFNQDYSFYAPTFIFVELFKHKEKLIKYTSLSESDLLELFNDVLDQIEFINPSLISNFNKREAKKWCEDIDKNDLLYLALTFELDGVLLTGDKRLKNHLLANGFTRLFEY